MTREIYRFSPSRRTLLKLSAAAPANGNQEHSLFQWLVDGVRKLHNLTF